MLKYVIIISFGYIVFKILKNGAFLAVENILNKKHLDKPTDLIKCTQCENYVSAEFSKKFKKMHFCSEECISEYRQSN